MPDARPTLPTLPPRWRTDRLLGSDRSALAGAAVVGDDDGLLVIRPGADGPSVAGYGPGSGRLALRLAAAGELAALRWLDLPRVARLTASESARLGVEPLPGWDWMATTTPPEAPRARVVRLDPSEDLPAILDCLAEANPDTWAKPGAADDAGWWGVAGPGGLAGVIGARLHDGESTSSASWQLHGLGVRPCARRQGIGEALTAAATRAGLAEGVDWVSLGVWAANTAAIALYRRLGFVTEHERGSYRPLRGPSVH